MRGGQQSPAGIRAPDQNTHVGLDVCVPKYIGFDTDQPDLCRPRWPPAHQLLILMAYPFLWRTESDAAGVLWVAMHNPTQNAENLPWGLIAQKCNALKASVENPGAACFTKGYQESPLAGQVQRAHAEFCCVGRLNAQGRSGGSAVAQPHFLATWSVPLP